MLGAGPGDAGDIAFLEGVIANQRCRHLPRENDNGNRVGVGGGNARDGIRCPRAGCHQGDTYFTRCPGIAVGGVNRSLFMADQDVSDIASVKFVIDVNDRTTGIAENGVHIFFLEHFQ